MAVSNPPFLTPSKKNMAITEFSAALKQVATERGISEESILDGIRTAIASAYRKDYAPELEDIESIKVELDPDTGETKILDADGKDVTPSGFGRIAAQTAKQVILQKIRETEKEVILGEFKAKLGQIVIGTVFRVENGVVVLDLGKAQGVLPQQEQVSTEEYRAGQRLKVLVKDIRETSRGTEIIVSRGDPQFIVKLFEQEVPEIASKVVTIDAIAREAGSRTKMAVSSSDEKVDPVGSCVGQKGVRVQSIIAELHGEKIDIIPFSSDISKFIASSLSPARVTGVEINLEVKEAKVSVPEDQLSLAIGKEGQNVRLAAKLTHWRIDIKGAAGLFGDASGFVGGEPNEAAVVGVWDAAIKAAKKIQDDETEAKVEPEAEPETPVVEEKPVEKVEKVKKPRKTKKPAKE